jgi:hypothetical protein
MTREAICPCCGQEERVCDIPGQNETFEQVSDNIIACLECDAVFTGRLIGMHMHGPWGVRHGVNRGIVPISA